MNEALLKLHLLISPGSISATSLQASAAGHSPCAWPESRPLRNYGLAVAHANLSATQAKARGLLTSGIYGLSGCGSSRSADLQSCLESKLRAKTQTRGSTLYTLTWKPWITPSGVSRFRLRASAPRTSETGITGWVTATTRDWKDSGSDIAPRKDNGKNRYDQLPRQAVLCGWPTSTTTDSKKRGNVSPRKNGMALPKTVAMLRDCRFAIRLTASGEALTGSAAGMPSGGLLNPEHSRWLMGYPSEWSFCMVTVTPSSRSKPRSSSKP